MVINAHAHLAHKNMWSDSFWDSIADTFSRTLGIPKDQAFEEILPMFWASNAETYVAEMEKAGIDKAIVFGVDYGLIDGQAEWSVEEMNEWVAEQADEYPDKLTSYCAVDPRRGERAVELLEKAVEDWGMKGLKLHPTAGFYPDNSEYFPLYEKCVELDVPVQSHTAALITAPLESKYADPIHLDSVAAKFPDLKIIQVHFGGINWTLKCAEIMTSRPNVYAEISGHQINAAGMPEYELKTLRNLLNLPSLLGPSLGERIMFGSDWPYIINVMGDDAWVDWVKNIPEKGKEYDLEFTEEEIEKILHENAERILDL